MQSIQTKALPCTNTRGYRIKASCRRGSLVISYPALDMEDAHKFAAKALCDKFIKEDVKEYGAAAGIGNPWGRPFSTGCFQDNFYHVFTN